MEVRSYLIAFVATVFLEVGVALLLGYRKRAEVAAVFWVNVFSHPLVNFLIGIIGLLRATPASSNEIFLLEVSVVIVEWQLLCYTLPRQSRTRLLLLSITMNGVSYYFPWSFGQMAFGSIG
jgi:hypothetical protein